MFRSYHSDEETETGGSFLRAARKFSRPPEEIVTVFQNINSNN
jgi:hypothetical protein